MKNSLSIASIAIIIMLAACTAKHQATDSRILSETDRYYSSLSAKEGMNVAFLAMFDQAGVMLRANHMPVEGYDAIRYMLLSESDSAFTLTWEPMFAKMAASGDLGYTYGTYRLKEKGTDSIIGVGKYTTIWVKQADGKWKAILDTGNPGLGK